MSTFTEHYNLIKPQEEDYYDVQDFNENFDTIDAQMMETETAVAGIGEKLGTATDNGNTTVFGKLNQVSKTVEGIRFIKSIQYVTHKLNSTASSESCAIAEVDPSRCIVILERLRDSTNSGTAYMSYALNPTHLSITHSSYSASSNTNIEFGFWIIEFY